MKEIYSFEVNKKVEKTVEEKKQEDGKEITVTSTSTEDVPVNIILRKPRRSDYDEAELYYGVQLSEGIKAGLLTRALLAKRFSNDGGVLSENDKDEYADLYVEMFDIQNEIERLSILKESEKIENHQESLNQLIKKQAVAKKNIQEFEMSQAALFDQTAETRARNKTILWWILNMSYLQEGNDYSPYFGEGSFEEKLDRYDQYEEVGEEFDEEVIRKLIYYVSFWYVGKATNRSDFEQVLKELETQSEGIVENNKSKEDDLTEAVEEAVEQIAEETSKEKPKAKKKKAPAKKEKDIPQEENSSSDSPME